MLAAIDKNAGGKLSKSDSAPTNETLFFLMQKPMLIKVMVWDMNDKKGNWVAAVSPRSVEEPVQVAPKAVSEIISDDDIPF
jgi:hypothetical protein